MGSQRVEHNRVTNASLSSSPILNYWDDQKKERTRDRSGQRDANCLYGQKVVLARHNGRWRVRWVCKGEERQRQEMPQRGEAIWYQPSKSIVHHRQVALYSSKAIGKGSEMAALGRHPITFQMTAFLGNPGVQKSYEPVQAWLSLLNNWSLSNILKWDLEPRSRWRSTSSLMQTKCQCLLTFLLLQFPIMCRDEGPVSRTLQPNAFYQFLGSISPWRSVPPSLRWGTRIHILERNQRVLWTTLLKTLLPLNIQSPSLPPLDPVQVEGP